MRSSSGVTFLSFSASSQNTTVRSLKTRLGIIDNPRHYEFVDEVVRPIGSDKPRARSLHPARVAGLDRAAGAFPALGCGVAALLLLLPPQDWFRPTAPLRSYAGGLLRKETEPFPSRCLIEKSAACLPMTSQQASLALLLP